ncbi:MAG: tRNA (5-methylaminomethyl-2-thiouridine)(34)-methyltransferase MnmD [Bacteroidales bacterium]|jgi:tRNA U34 5-methylaminomethyl-2-thiouridine-forming methyltransferase MnmC
MVTGKNNPKPVNTESCPRPDGFFSVSPAPYIETSDGSLTLMSSCGETYHSTGGAVEESQHVYIESGLRYYLEEREKAGLVPAVVHIFELGLGTGLNALLTYREMFREKFPASVHIFYSAVEMNPLEAVIWEKLDYARSEKENDFFRKMHMGPWNEPFVPAPGFTLIKLKKNYLNLIINDLIDVVYYDAFSPAVQPELWTSAALGQLLPALTANGILTTYSCKGSFKQVLRDWGFSLQKLPGTGKKRHILRAVYGSHNSLITGVSNASMSK